MESGNSSQARTRGGWRVSLTLQGTGKMRLRAVHCKMGREVFARDILLHPFPDRWIVVGLW